MTRLAPENINRKELTKSAQIRAFRQINPTATPAEIAATLSSHGTKITASLVSTVLANDRRSAAKPASKPSPDVQITDIIAVKRFAYAVGVVHTNGLENFWSLLKRSLGGTYTAVAPFHLHRYVAEQAFRFNERRRDDAGRFLAVLKGIVGKRLTYRVLTAQDDAGFMDLT